MPNQEDLSDESLATLKSIYDYLVRHEELFAVRAEQVFGNIALAPFVTNLPSIIQGLLAQGFLIKEAEGLAPTLKGLMRINAVPVASPLSFNFFRFVLLIAIADQSLRLLDDGADVPLIDPLALSLQLRLAPPIDWIERAAEEFAMGNLLTKNSVTTSDHVPATLVMPTFIGLYLARIRKRQLIDGTVDFNGNEPTIEEVSRQNFTTLDVQRDSVDLNPQAKIPGDTNPTGENYSASDSPSPSIPAADRFVTRADNAPFFEDADKKLQAVIDAIPADNELRVSAEDRLLLVREVKDIKSLINQPRVQLRAIYHATRESSILVWFAKELASGVVQALATAAVAALLLLLAL